MPVVVVVDSSTILIRINLGCDTGFDVGADVGADAGVVVVGKTDGSIGLCSRILEFWGGNFAEMIACDWWGLDLSECLID